MGDTHWEGQALVDLAFAHWMTFSWDHIPQSERFATDALKIARTSGDTLVLARSLTHLGLMDMVHGRLDDGDRKYEESLQIAEAAGFKDAVVDNLAWLGAHANWRGDFARAISFCTRAAEVARECHGGFGEIYALAFQCLGSTPTGRSRSTSNVQRGVPGVALVSRTDILIGTPAFGDEMSSTIGPDIMRSECANR